MENKFQTLPAGSYTARCEEVVRKTNKDDSKKKIISLKMNVKDHAEQFYHLNLCVEGYSENQCRVSNEIMDEMCKDFNVSMIDELVGKEGILSVSINGNMKFATAKQFYDWKQTLPVPCEAKFPCVVKRCYQSNKAENKYVFIVEVDVNGNKHDEFVSYDLTNNFKNESFQYLCKKLNINGEANDINKPALLVVKRVDKDGVSYINKRIGFEKVVDKPKQW